MRMRERPSTNAVAERVSVIEPHSPSQESENVDHTNTPQQHLQRQQFKSRGHQHCQPFQLRSYTRCTDSSDHGNELEFSKHQGKYRNFFCTKTVVQTDRLLRSRSATNDLTSETPVLFNSYLLYQGLNNRTTSPFIRRKVPRQTSQLYHTACVMTRNASSLRSKSACSNKTNPENSSSSVPNNISRGLNGRTGHWSYIRARTNSQNPNDTNIQTSTKDTVQKCTRNNYRHIDESIFKLSSDNPKHNASSGVNFHLADDEKKSPGCSQIPVAAAANHSMSFPDLPPITNGTTSRGDKRKISTSSVTFHENKPSLNKLAAPVNRRTNYSRRSSTDTSDSCADASASMAGERWKRFPTFRDQSDSSKKNLQANGSVRSNGSSGSTKTSCIMSQTKEVRGGSQSRDGAKKGGVIKEMKYLTNGHRAHSLCAATDLTDSQGRLETLVEGQSSDTSKLTPNNIKNNNSVTDNKQTYNQRVISKVKTNSKNVTSRILENGARSTNNNDMYDMPSIARSASSMSVSGNKNREGNSINLKISNRNPMKENRDDRQIDAVDALIAKGRMVRSNSENKLNGQSIYYSNEHKSHTTSHENQAAQHSISRNLPLNRFERQKLKSQQQSREVPSRSHQRDTFKIRRFNSVSNIYNESTRDPFNDAKDQEDLYYAEESIEVNSRLVEWLKVVNNIDKYDTDPKNDVVEYSDDPPQTDTAIHVVYDGE